MVAIESARKALKPQNRPLERQPRVQKLDLDQAERVSAYLGGESVTAMAKELCVHRITVADPAREPVSKNDPRA